MANFDESNPLLANQETEPNDSEKKSSTTTKTNPPPPVVEDSVKQSAATAAATLAIGWTADGLPMPMGHGTSMMGRTHWDSDLCACFGRNDEFCSSDLEVCLLGSFAPCVLYGSNVERLGSASGSFSNHCLLYTGLYLIGNSLTGWNCLAPWFSYPTRSAIRQKFNLEGSCEGLNRSCGCCGSLLEDEVKREICESGCDLATHIFCHPCALCQEGRELRRRLPHSGFRAQQVLIMIPPAEQTMGRGL